MKSETLIPIFLLSICQKYLSEDKTNDPLTTLYETKITPMTILHVNRIYNQYLEKLHPEAPPKILTAIESIPLRDIGIEFTDILDLLKSKDNTYYFVIRSNTAFFGGLGPIFASSYFILFYIKERSTLFRFIQRIAGLNTAIYWFVAFVIDYLTFLTVLLVYFTMMISIRMELYSTINEIKDLIPVTMLFPAAILPITYLLSFNFDHATYGYIWTLVGYIFFGKMLYKRSKSFDD